MRLKIPRNFISLRSLQDLTAQLDQCFQLIENFSAQQSSVYVRIDKKTSVPVDIRRGDLVFNIPPTLEGPSIQYFDGKNLRYFELSSFSGTVSLVQLPDSISSLPAQVESLITHVAILDTEVATLQLEVAELQARPLVPLVSDYNGVDVNFIYSDDLTDFIYADP